MKQKPTPHQHPRGSSHSPSESPVSPPSRLWYAAFLIPLAGIMVLPLYNRVEPAVAGFPFFYWFQLLLVVIGAVVTFVVYLATPQSDEILDPPHEATMKAREGVQA